MNIQLEAIQLTQQISHLCNYSHYKLYSDSVGAAGFSKEGFKVAMAHGTHGIFLSATLPPRNSHLMSYASCHHVAASWHIPPYLWDWNVTMIINLNEGMRNQSSRRGATYEFGFMIFSHTLSSAIILMSAVFTRERYFHHYENYTE